MARTIAPEHLQVVAGWDGEILDADRRVEQVELALRRPGQRVADPANRPLKEDGRRPLVRETANHPCCVTRLVPSINP
jgi:hypothetical protein